MKMPEPLLKCFSHLSNFDHSIYDITAKEVMDIDEKAAVFEISNFKDEDKSHDEELDKMMIMSMRRRMVMLKRHRSKGMIVKLKLLKNMQVSKMNEYVK